MPDVRLASKPSRSCVDDQGHPGGDADDDRAGRLRSRPMVTQRAAFDGELWFLTARAAGKTGEIRDRQAVHVTFVSPVDNRYVWVSGTASLVETRRG